MKHLKTFESHSTNEAWEDVMKGDAIRREEKIAKVKELGIEAGDFVSLAREYGDVWHEVESVGDTYITVYKPVNAKQPEVKTDLVSLSKVTNHSKSLPSDSRCSSLKTGYYSPNTGNSNQIPEFYKRNTGVDSIIEKDK